MPLAFPNAPTNGQEYSDQGKTWTWNGYAWDLTSNGSSSGNGSSHPGFLETDQIINTNYTSPAGKNVISAGPVQVSDGTTVTIATGATWTVV